MDRFRTDDGVEIEYQIDDFRDPWATGPGETILMHHGLAKNMKYWTQWVPALSRKYRVIRYNCRGCGGSPVPQDGVEWTVERLIRDAVNLIDRLEIDKVHWAGFESGSTMGILFAMTYPERIKSLTLVDSTSNFWVRTPADPDVSPGSPRSLVELQRLGQKEWMASTIRNRVDISVLDEASGRRVADWYMEEMQRTPHQVMIALKSHIDSFRNLAEDPSRVQVLAKVRVPTLMMVGDSSAIDPLEGQVILRNSIPDARLVVFPKIGHAIYLLMPDRCTEEVLKFLEGVP